MSGIGKHCQLCGGPVVNGRCKLCGMPYHNDEERYHLNESREDHYRHASAAEKRQMRQQEKALPDQRKSTVSSKAHWNNTAGRTTSTPQPAEKAFRPAPKPAAKMFQQTAPNTPRQTTIPNKPRSSNQKKQQGLSRLIGILVWIILLIFMSVFTRWFR